MTPTLRDQLEDLARLLRDGPARMTPGGPAVKVLVPVAFIAAVETVAAALARGEDEE